jgi:hypothetical protein
MEQLLAILHNMSTHDVTRHKTGTAEIYREDVEDQSEGFVGEAQTVTDRVREMRTMRETGASMMRLSQTLGGVFKANDSPFRAGPASACVSPIYS